MGASPGVLSDGWVYRGQLAQGAGCRAPGCRALSVAGRGVGGWEGGSGGVRQVHQPRGKVLGEWLLLLVGGEELGAGV